MLSVRKVKSLILQNIDLFAVQGFVHAAYNAEFSAHVASIAVIVFRQAAFAQTTCRFGIKSADILGFPVQIPACRRYAVVDVARAWNPLRDIGGMGGDF